jgi:predicted RNA-binding Zn ribbon-like protein
MDLVNTVRDRKSGGRETLRAPADLSKWLVEARLTPAPAEATEADLLTARELRAAIDTAAFAVIEERPVPADEVALINTVAAAVSLAPSLGLDADGRPLLTWDPSTAIPAALARIAVDSISLLTDGELARLRVCAADDCEVRFVDRSPARNRQWCSMRRCGNRTKARRHYARGRD